MFQTYLLAPGPHAVADSYCDFGAWKAKMHLRNLPGDATVTIGTLQTSLKGT